jgi:adenylate cyclase
MIPKGSYVPTFTIFRDAAEAVGDPVVEAGQGPAPERRTNPAIRVARFDGDDEGGPRAGHGFTRHLIGALSRFGDLDVYGGASPNGADSAEVGPSGPEVDFLLIGSVSGDDERFKVEALLSDARTGRHLWGETLERPLQPTALHAVRDEVAESVARIVAQPWGLIHAARAREARERPPEQITSYDCVSQFYAYLRNYDRTLHPGVVACLERAVAMEPNYAEAVACLALAYADAARFGYDAGSAADPVARALELGARAVDLAPFSSRSRHALGMARWFAADVAGAFEALEAGVALNPNDSEIMADLGTRYILRGEWERGEALIRASYTRNPAQPGVFCAGLALAAFIGGRHHEALAYARRVAAPTVVYGHALVAIAAVRLGLRDEAADAVAQILLIDPTYGDRVDEDLAARNLAPDIAQTVIAALRLAGLPESREPLRRARRAGESD